MTNKEYEVIMLSVLRAYLAMAEGMTNNGSMDETINPFHLNPRAGLCNAIDRYTEWNYPDKQFRVANGLHTMLIGQMHRKNVDSIAYPFGEADYYQRVKDNTQHECPERLAFVKQYIEYLET